MMREKTTILGLEYQGQYYFGWNEQQGRQEIKVLGT